MAVGMDTGTRGELGPFTRPTTAFFQVLTSVGQTGRIFALCCLSTPQSWKDLSLWEERVTLSKLLVFHFPGYPSVNAFHVVPR